MSRADRHSYFALAAVLALMLHAAFVTVISRTTIDVSSVDSTRWLSPGRPLTLAFDEPAPSTAPPNPPTTPERELAREPEQPPPPTPEPPQPPPPEIVALGIEDGTSAPTPAWLGFKDETEHHAHRSTVVQPQLDPDAGGPPESRPHGAGGDSRPLSPPAPSSTTATPEPPPEPNAQESQPKPSEQDSNRDPKSTQPKPAPESKPPVEDSARLKPQGDAPSPEKPVEEPVTQTPPEAPSPEKPAEAASGADIELTAPRLELGPIDRPARPPVAPEPRSRESADQPESQTIPETTRGAVVQPISPERLRELERLVDEMMQLAPASPGGAGPAGDPNDAPESPSTRPGAPAEPSDKQSDATSLEEPIEIVLGHPAAAKGLEIITRRPQFSKITRVVAYPDNPLVEATFARDGRVIAARLTKSSGYVDVDQPVLDAVYAWRAKGEALQKLPPYPEPGSAGAQAAAENPKAFGLTLKFTIILRDDR